MPLPPVANDPSPLRATRRLPRPEDFTGERGGFAPWCGPTAVATAVGVDYAGACALLARVTGHFCLLEVARGGARVFDNRLHGAPLSARAHGRRRVTHLARVPAPPGAE